MRKGNLRIDAWKIGTRVLLAVAGLGLLMGGFRLSKVLQKLGNRGEIVEATLVSSGLEDEFFYNWRGEDVRYAERDSGIELGRKVFLICNGTRCERLFD